ncbi:hypothetical protein AtEden1_Chr5g0110001 [Arabidopsis thaliana]
MAKIPSLSASPLDSPWLRFEVSERFWWLEVLGPFFAPSLVKSKTACAET